MTKRKKAEGGGINFKVGCAYNNYLNLEKHSHTGMCNYIYYKDYMG